MNKCCLLAIIVLTWGSIEGMDEFMSAGYDTESFREGEDSPMTSSSSEESEAMVKWNSKEKRPPADSNISPNTWNNFLKIAKPLVYRLGSSLMTEDFLSKHPSVDGPSNKINKIFTSDNKYRMGEDMMGKENQIGDNCNFFHSSLTQISSSIKDLKSSLKSCPYNSENIATIEEIDSLVRKISSNKEKGLRKYKGHKSSYTRYKNNHHSFRQKWK
nr:uncharacterized protein LOC121120380 isoform X3 [Lepeophtheirus salmonis]